MNPRLIRFSRTLIYALILLVPALAFAQAGNDTTFVSLTNAPFLEDAGNAANLTAFLNSLYKICIGVAATVAVLQIMRAGIIYMGGDSVTEKKDAKNLIAMSIGGLILVLSPVIVFSIINPEILSLKIGNLTDLAVEQKKLLNDLLDGGESGAGNATVAPHSVIPATGEPNASCTYYPDGAILPATDETAEVCCNNQQSATNSCAAVNKPTQDTAHPGPRICRCEFKGSIAVPKTYLKYYLYNSQEIRSTDMGVVPRDRPDVLKYQTDCAAAGGSLKTESDASWFERRQQECPADSGVNSAKTYTNGGTSGYFTQYQCEDRKITCEYRR